MDLNINISLGQFLKPSGGGQEEITYSEARNLPLPRDFKHSSHKVKKGETIESIAKLYGLSSVHLSEFLREDTGVDSIFTGQDIKLPTRIEKI